MISGSVRVERVDQRRTGDGGSDGMSSGMSSSIRRVADACSVVVLLFSRARVGQSVFLGFFFIFLLCVHF
jgi:hypothetical protein